MVPILEQRYKHLSKRLFAKSVFILTKSLFLSWLLAFSGWRLEVSEWIGVIGEVGAIRAIGGNPLRRPVGTLGGV